MSFLTLKLLLINYPFILVTSAATGLCAPNSEVHVAIICDKEIYHIISEETTWGEGRI